MKRIVFVFVFLACILMSGCEKFGRRVLDITNNADYDIMVYHPLISNYDDEERHRLTNYYNYPDTSLSPWMPSTIQRVPKGSSLFSLYENVPKFFKERLKDTTSMFIFNADSLDLYGWDSIYTHDILIQRYDFNYEMLDKFEGADENHGDWIEVIAFPPTKRMGEMIKMWPPYGTYDENGHRVKP